MFIDVLKIKKSYKTGDIKLDVLKDVSMDLDRENIGVILGPSGSGKSTLLNIIGGVDKADSGKVTIDGVNITGLDDNKLTEYRRDSIGFVFQFYNLVPNLTVLENIEVVSNIAKSPLDIKRILKSVDLESKTHSFPKELSGGEQQRVAIARAIVKNPKLLLCDEPTGALDFETSRSILSLLQRVNKEYKTTILMITHNVAISLMANKIYKLRSGEIIETTKNPNPVAAERIEW
ncbi:MAG: ABC transporter ATP-binding protein [Oscillospiraceae bacterium]|nr:ABC transporter ATP-binding protein [Oscillospiraceae bacterium]